METRLNSLLRITVKHTYLRGTTFYFRRPVPKDLQGVIGRTTIKKNLHTADPIEAAGLVAKIKDQLEIEWANLRDVSLLRAPEIALQQPYQQEGSFNEALPLPVPIESVAAPAYPSPLVRTDQESISFAMEFYFQTHEKGNKATFQRLPRIAVEQFIEAIGEKPVQDISRDDVRYWMETAAAKGHSKNTIIRRLACLRAIMALYIREKELDVPNRFEKHSIPANAKRAKKRNTFAASELLAVQSACKELDDDVRWVAAMLSDTCSRLAEIVGLRISDIVLEAPTPYISIEEHDARGLKTPDSRRVIPLVGTALWAAKRVIQEATSSQIYAFPRYTKTGSCNANSASATINKWLRSQGAEHTSHEFRHTTADRLRDVGCPKEIIEQIGGWSKADMSQNYGQGHSLRRTREWMEKLVINIKE